MTIDKIYFDMDGVLADFNKGVIELCHKEPFDQQHKTPQLSNDLFDAIKQTEHFYDRLELMPGAKELFDAVYGRYGDRVEILSGLPKPWRGIDTAAPEKTAWVRRLLSEDIVLNLVIREEKKNFCKGPGSILIDDYASTIRIWEELGGTGVLHKDAASTLQQLKEMEIL